MTQRSPQARFDHRLVLGSSRRGIQRAQRSLISAAQQRGYDRASCFALRLALEEALTNAILHGNRNNPRKKVTVRYRVDSGRVVIEIEDQGEGFDPQAVPDPTRPENVEIPAGRGIVLMRAYMTEVEFTAPGNRVRMTYVRPTAQG